jgi:putative ABC transport system ATP-binding protein
MIVLELDRVSKTRGRGRRAVSALREISLAIRSGEFLLLEGPSGSGKTTLLGVAAGLLTPTSGGVRLAGRWLGALDHAARRALRATRVGFVFQRANLLARLSVAENVMLMGAIANGGHPAERREVLRLLAMLDVEAVADRKPRELSGGEEQRVAVARALVHHPAIVFADEPTGNLDGAAGRAVASALTVAARECGAAVLVATHDARLHPYASRRVCIEDGVLLPYTSLTPS